MKEIIEFIKFLNFLNREDNFLITCHVNADGDAYASSLAMAQMLKKMGKKYFLVFPDEKLEHRYDFLPYFNEIKPYSEDMQINDIQAAIICDAPGIRRIGDVEKLLPPFEKRFKIDHHPDENGLAKYNYVDDKASSASKLVYNLIAEAGLKFDADIAKTIYTGISYDTGRFSYANASPEDYYIASQLMKFDIEIHEINRRLFFNYKAEALTVIGYGLANMQRYENGAINIIFIPNDKLQKVILSDIEDLSAFSVSVDGTRVGVYIREIEPGFFKMSLRTTDNTPVNKVANEFNGGGHKRAAGCRYEGNFDELLSKLVETIKKYW